MKYVAEISIFKPSAIADDIGAVAQATSVKNTNFYSLLTDVPVATAIGDNWFVQDASGNCIGIKRWDGSAWVDEPLTGDVLVAHSIKAVHIDFQTLSGQTIEGLTIIASPQAVDGFKLTRMDGYEYDDTNAVWEVSQEDEGTASVVITGSGFVSNGLASDSSGEPEVAMIPARIRRYTNNRGVIRFDDIKHAWIFHGLLICEGIRSISGYTYMTNRAVQNAIHDYYHNYDDASELAAATGRELEYPDLINGNPVSGWGGCWYYKIGTRVHLHIAVSGITANSNVQLCTMPQGFRPYNIINAAGRGSNGSEVSNLWVESTGAVYIRSVASTGIADIEYDAFA